MTADSVNIPEYFRAICDERGGVNKLSIVEAAVAKALAQCLAAEPIDAGLVVSLTAQLPPVSKGKIDTLTVRFIDGDPDKGQRNEEMRLRNEIKELRRQLVQATGEPLIERGVSEQPYDEINAVRPSPPPPAGNVVPLKHNSVYGVLADLNRAFSPSPYVGIDPNDRRDYSPLK
jgi:hypothetical protein